MESRRIADQLRRSLQGVAWHGPSLLEILDDVSADEAAARPLPAAHSIGEIVAHVTAWLGAAERGLDDKVVSLQGDADWPVPGDWDASLQSLRQAIASLSARIEAMSDDDLRQKVRSSDNEYSRYFLLHGVTQHNLYHAGQLALLKKAVRA